MIAGPSVTAPDQEALDAAVFYLLSSAHTSSRNGLPIDAYSCLECLLRGNTHVIEQTEKQW